MLRTAGSAAAAVLMLALGACGGSKSSSTSTSTSTGAAFAASAYAICTQDAVADVAATRTPALRKPLAIKQIDALVAARQSALARLRALSAPSPVQASYRAFLVQWPAVEVVWRHGAAKVLKGYAVYDVPGAPAALDAAQASAAIAGLTACAGKLSPSDVSTITAFIRGSQLHPTANLCTQHTTARFLAVSGGMKGCLQSAKTYSTKVRIANLHGTAPIATAQVIRSGGNQPAGTLTFWMVKLGGRWQLDDAF